LLGESNVLTRRACVREANGTWPNIPPKANRLWKSCFSPVLYGPRNAIKRMFCRVKDFRRIATRYDRLATNFLTTTGYVTGLRSAIWTTSPTD
jgi:transposase